jgi:hypothetical protein
MDLFTHTHNPIPSHPMQGFIFDRFGVIANYLLEGDAGTERCKIDGRRRQRLPVEGGSGKGGKGGKRKRGAHMVELHGWSWDSREEYVIEQLIGKMVVDGETPMPGREGERIAAGSVLYRVLWKGWPPELATWEELRRKIRSRVGKLILLGSMRQA